MSVGTTGERGTALLTVLLLVAVMATVASTLLDRVGVATELASNARNAGQARAWLTSAEALTLTRIEDLRAANPERLTDRGWLGLARSIRLPDGGTVEARLLDGGNCFNLNALAKRVDGRVLATRAEGVAQFAALIRAVGLTDTRASQIAARAADYVDDDDLPGHDGLERGGYPAGTLPANRMMAEASELRAIPGVTAEEWARLSRWICALPVVGGSPVNVNTLRPDEAPLLVMLSRGAIDPERARAILARRPPAGFVSASDAVPVADSASGGASDAGPAVTTRFFRLVAEVAGVRGDSARYEMSSLIDSASQGPRVIARRWTIQ